MTHFAFEVPGRPVTWKRTATVTGSRGQVQRATPKAMREAKAAVQWRCLHARPDGWPLDARYAVTVHVHLRNHSAEGDVDRYANLVLDAIQGGAYANDRQVDDLHVSKRFGDGLPRTVVNVTVLEGE